LAIGFYIRGYWPALPKSQSNFNPFGQSNRHFLQPQASAKTADSISQLPPLLLCPYKYNPPSAKEQVRDCPDKVYYLHNSCSNINSMPNLSAPPRQI